MNFTIPETHVEPTDTRDEFPETRQDAVDDLLYVHVEPSHVDDTAMETSPKANLNPPSPPRATKDAICDEEGVEITGTSNTTLVFPVLAKHTTKSATPEVKKGKSKEELTNIEKLDFEEVHAGYLNRLSTSRDLEASLVNMVWKNMMYVVLH
ncbi:hypothetical protein D1007_15637 [Hordeum vulgare]|nr:hypothetical protein D1007_15637 [Hordeum vulgare]